MSKYEIVIERVGSIAQVQRNGQYANTPTDLFQGHVGQ